MFWQQGIALIIGILVFCFIQQVNKSQIVRKALIKVLITLFILPPASCLLPSPALAVDWTHPLSFSNAELGRRDFSGQSLQAAEFSNANMEMANFTGADLRGAVMSAFDSLFH